MRKLILGLALSAFVLPGVTSWVEPAQAQQTQAKTPAKKKPKRKPASKKKPATAAAAGAAAATGAAAPVPAPAAAPTPPTAPAPEPSSASATADKSAPVPETKPAPESKPTAVAGELYTVAEDYKVDANTMNGFRTWRSAACDRCHGANQEGIVGPSLINSLKVLSKAEFKTVVLDGRLEKGMPSFNTSDQVVKNIDWLYAYLKSRPDGAITRAKVAPID